MHGRRRHEADLADAAGAVRALGICLFDEDQLHLRHLVRPQHAAVVHLLGEDDAALGFEIFGERVADSHVERAVHLASSCIGLSTRPTSWAAIIFTSLPSSSRMATCVAKP